MQKLGFDRSVSSKAVWANRKAVDNTVKSGIIEATRPNDKTHRYVGANGQQIIDKPKYNRLTKNGGIIRGDDVSNHLGNNYTSYLPSFNVAFIRDDATVSDVLEEMYHAKQDRQHLFSETVTQEVRLRREIDAQKYLLSVTDKYKIPHSEVDVTKRNLAYYEEELEKKLRGKED
jgi:hypothetical protein